MGAGGVAHKDRQLLSLKNFPDLNNRLKNRLFSCEQYCFTSNCRKLSDICQISAPPPVGRCLNSVQYVAVLDPLFSTHNHFHPSRLVPAIIDYATLGRSSRFAMGNIEIS